MDARILRIHIFFYFPHYRANNNNVQLQGFQQYNYFRNPAKWGRKENDSNYRKLTQKRF